MYHGQDKQEQAIARRILKAILAAGYSVRVHDEEGETSGATQDEATAWNDMGETGVDTLVVLNGRRIGSITLIWGNDEDLVSDTAHNPNYEGSEAIIAKLAGE